VFGPRGRQVDVLLSRDPDGSLIVIGGSALHDHLSLTVDRQRLGPTRALEPLQVRFGIAAKIGKRSNVFRPWTIGVW
jgi:hypothetical protein